MLAAYYGSNWPEIVALLARENGDMHYTVPQLIEMYNDAVELIWSLRDEIRELEEDLESYQQAADELIDRLYG